MCTLLQFWKYPVLTNQEYMDATVISNHEKEVGGQGNAMQNDKEKQEGLMVEYQNKKTITLKCYFSTDSFIQ